MGLFNAIGGAFSGGATGAAFGGLTGLLFGGLDGAIEGAFLGGGVGAAFGGARGLFTPDYGAMMGIGAPMYAQPMYAQPMMYGGYPMGPSLFGAAAPAMAGFGTGMMMGAAFEMATYGSGCFGYPGYGFGFGGFGGLDGNPFTPFF